MPQIVSGSPAPASSGAGPGRRHRRSNGMMRFLGNIEAKLDAKGRVFLPAAFRKVLQGAGEQGLVMRKDVFQPCLVLYPESVWGEQMDGLRRRLSRWDMAEQQLFRQFVSEVEPVALDANGRFIIPRRCLRQAAIAQDVRFIGMGDTIEIWPAQAAGSPFVEPQAFAEALQGAMGGKCGACEAGRLVTD